MHLHSLYFGTRLQEQSASKAEGTITAEKQVEKALACLHERGGLHVKSLQNDDAIPVIILFFLFIYLKMYVLHTFRRLLNQKYTLRVHSPSLPTVKKLCCLERLYLWRLLLGKNESFLAGQLQD